MTELLADSRVAPQQIGAVLRLAYPMPSRVVEDVLGAPVVAVPRLRRRLRSVPWGLGRPIWVDDDTFDVKRHVRRRILADPSDQRTVETIAAGCAVDRLPRDRPLWRTTFLVDDEDRCHTVVFVLHHVLVDGVGGVAALSRLLDGDEHGPSPEFPSAPPSRRDLLRDALMQRWATLRRLRSARSRLRSGISELGGGSRGPRVRLAPRTSLNRPIGARRTLGVARVPLSAIVEVAHAAGGTVNDLLLTAVGGAFGAVLRAAGDTAEEIVISVPVSGRSHLTDGDPGNDVGVRAVRIPTVGDAQRRLEAIITSRCVDGAPDPGQWLGRGSSAAILGLAFRGLARLHLFGLFVHHQRLVNTFVTNVRGPAQPLLLAGTPIADVIAISPISGNISVAFAAISYAGTFAVSVIADLDHSPDARAITAALQHELNILSRCDAAGP